MKNIKQFQPYISMEDVLEKIEDIEAEEAAGIDDVVLTERTAGWYSIDWIPDAGFVA